MYINVYIGAKKLRKTLKRESGDKKVNHNLVSTAEISHNERER